MGLSCKVDYDSATIVVFDYDSATIVVFDYDSATIVVFDYDSATIVVFDYDSATIVVTCLHSLHWIRFDWSLVSLLPHISLFPMS